MDCSVVDSPAAIVRRPSVCPHDCPSVCALDVEVIDGKRIGRVRGAEEQRYTAGVICAKVARYAELGAVFDRVAGTLIDLERYPEPPD